MLKTNSQKLLLWLDPVKASQTRRVPFKDLAWMFIDLTPAGRLSLVRVLQEKQLLFSDDLQGFTRLTISSHGKERVKQLFPALKLKADAWQGEWLVLIFLQAPKSDQHFRYLRSLLVRHNCFALKRGVYLYPGDLPATVQATIKQTYTGAVVVLKISDWHFGDPQIIIGQKLALQELNHVYSGISKELDDLLVKNVDKKRLISTNKEQLSLLFDRFYQTFKNDLGLAAYYFPQDISGIKILNRLKNFLA